jgi:hypothetical protein
MVQEEVRLSLVRILVQVVNPSGVERGSTALHAMHNIAFGQKQLGEIGTVLACNAGYESGFRHR